jgi:hypothetical protein
MIEASGKEPEATVRSGQSWFPIRSDMVERTEFGRLSPCAGAVLLDVNYRLHEHLRLVELGFRAGPFEHFDAAWAHRLRMSVATFRSARGKLASLGWIRHTPGYHVPHGKPQPTRYHEALFCRAARGVECAAFRRSLWAAVIEHLQRGELQHVDLVVAAVLAYFWQVGGGSSLGTVSVPKWRFTSTGQMVKTVRASATRISCGMPGVLDLAWHRTSIEFQAGFDGKARDNCS